MRRVFAFDFLAKNEFVYDEGMLNSICVFLGSSTPANPIYMQTTIELGKTLVENKMNLVYGGASVGLMGALADTVLKGGGQVFGVIPKSLQEKEIAHKNLTKLYVVESMHERKRMMFDLADGFITLPGGLGSLEEMCEILTWAQLGLHKKPCGLLNVNAYYQHLIAQFDHSVREGMMRTEHRQMLIVENSAKNLLKHLREYVPPSTEKWIGRQQV